MAKGDEEYSGDYTDSSGSGYGDDLSRYSQDAQDYIRANSQTRLNGVPVDDDGKNTAGFSKFGRKTDEEGNKKWSLLKKGEEDASKKPNSNGKGGDKKASLNEKENNVESDDQSTGSKFKNAVKGMKDLKSGRVGKAKGRFKKSGPLIATLMLCLGFGATSFFGQMAMPFSLMSVLQGNFDSIGVSNLSRSNRMLRWQMKPGSRKVSNEADEFVKKHSKIYQKFTGSSEKYFDISARQKRKFKKAGIEVKTNKSTGEKTLEFKRPSGETMSVTADDFKTKLETDTEFKVAFEEGTKTWRKSVGSWFDNTAKAFLSKIKVVRNRFKDYRKKDSAAKNKESLEVAMKEATGDADIGGKTGDASLEETEETVKNKDGSVAKDKNGNEIKKKGANFSTGSDNELGIKRGAKAAEVKEKLTKFSNGVGLKISKITKALASAGCIASEIVGAINLLVIASEAMQIIQVASTVFESIQKAQVGDSSSSPINEIGNALTQSKTTKYETKDGEKVEKTGSAMSSAGISALYGNTATDAKDPSVNSFNLRDSINSIMHALGGTMEAYTACTIAKIGAGLIEAGLDAVDVATDVASIVACIGGAVFTAGASCAGVVAKAVLKVAGGITASALISKAIEAIISYAVPKIVVMAARDYATNIGGEDFGNAIASGANMLMGQNHQFGGGSVASKETLMAYLKEQEQYNQEIAYYDRRTLSPFDASSQYTFLGSLLAKSVPLLTQTSSITGGITNLSNIVVGSLSSIVPHASAMQSAITAQKAAEQTAKVNPELDSIGAVSDAFGNPYFVTDFGTMDEDPAEVVYEISKMNDGHNFETSGEDEDTPVINEHIEDSELYEYIIYCGQRSASTFGMADQNVANSIDSGAGSVESSVPIWGGVADMLQGLKIKKNLGFVSGKACVTGNDGEGLGKKVFPWKRAKYYQRFIEDQRLAENMGLVEESSVSVALRHYYEKNPIDDSFEGLLSYYSGMSKEKVADSLDLLEASMWIAGYDPSGLYPINNKKLEALTRENAITIKEASSTNIITMSAPRIIYLSYRKEYSIG